MKEALPRKSELLPRISWILILVWMILLIGLSVSPLSFKLRLHTVGTYHAFGHYVVYLLTALLICQVARRFGERLAGFFFAIALALGQEWIENQMYHAGYEWKDVATDWAGTVSGFALVTLVTVLFQDSAASRHAK